MWNTSTYLKLQKEMDSRNHYNLVKTPSSELSWSSELDIKLFIIFLFSFCIHAQYLDTCKSPNFSRKYDYFQFKWRLFGTFHIVFLLKAQKKWDKAHLEIILDMVSLLN